MKICRLLSKRTGLLLAALLAFAGNVFAQEITIPGTSTSLTLQSDSWRYLRTIKAGDGSDIYVYYYSAKTILGSEGDTVLPCLRIYVNKNYNGDLYSLVYQRYMLQPYQSLNEYSQGPGLPRSGGLGYLGAYTNPSEHRDYEFNMTYFKSGTAFVELRLETTRDTYAAMEEEFNKILKSVK